MWTYGVMNLWKGFDDSFHHTSIQQSFLLLTAEGGCCRRDDSWNEASVQTDGWQRLFQKLSNNHIDFVISCCDFDCDSAVVDVVEGDRCDVRSAQRWWLVDIRVLCESTRDRSAALWKILLMWEILAQKNPKQTKKCNRCVKVFSLLHSLQSTVTWTSQQSVINRKQHFFH